MSFWERYARMGTARALGAILLALALAAVAWSQLDELHIDTRIEALLPQDTPAQQALDALRERAASDAMFSVLITSEDPALNRRLALRVADAIERWPEARWATARRDISVLTDAAALYLDTESLKALAEDVQALVDWEYCERMPGCVNFFERPELPDQEQLVKKLAESPSGQALEAYAGRDLVEVWREREADDREEGGEDGALLCSEDGSVCAVQASLEGSASDLSFARRMVDKAEHVFVEVRPEDAPPSLRMVVSGRYRNAPMERETINADLQTTTLVSSSLILLLLVLQFRGLRAIVLLLFPLAVAVVVTLGALALLHPTLNLISAFTLAILAGIGVDFGIHLLTHYGDERATGHGVEDALGHTLHKLFGSLLAAGATTGCAFAALAASDFRGIAEMGWKAGLGVALSLASFVLLFPVVTLLAHRVWAERGTLARRSWFANVTPPRPRQARAVAVAGLLLGVGGAIAGGGVDFETDFRNLSAPSVSHGIPSAGALKGTSGVSVYLMSESPEQLAAAADDLIERNFDGVGGKAGSLLLAPSVLLPRDQPVRLAALQDIRESLARLDKRAKGEKKEDLERLRRWVQVDAPLTPASLPVSVREALSERDGGSGRIGVLYLPVRGYDADVMETLSLQLERWRERYDGVLFASPSAMLGEVVPALRADALTILGLALLGLTLASAAFGRSLRRTALVLAPVILAMAASAGFMAVTDVRINLYNVLVLPLAFGVGVDGAVYVVWATARAQDIETFWECYKVAAQAVLGSSLTSLAAFGSIALATNPGLASLGKLAILTIALALVANLIWLPCWLLARVGSPAR